LAQKPQGVELTLLDGASRRWQLRGPIDLVLNLFNELSTLVGDALSLHEKNLASQSPDVRLSIGSESRRKAADASARRSSDQPDDR
jgi:hypothetical protein